MQIVGGREREIQVWVDPDKMRAYNVTVGGGRRTPCAQQNLEVPGGRVDEGTRELTVRTIGRIINPAEFNNIVVAKRGSVSRFKSATSATPKTARRNCARKRVLNGQPAVTLVVSKQSGQNTVAVADAVKERLAEIQPTLPPDFSTQIVGDQSDVHRGLARRDSDAP